MNSILNSTAGIQEVENLPNGIIIKGIGGFYYVETKTGVYECRARGIFRKDDVIPLPGDRVSISIIDEEEKTAIIDAIAPRVNKLERPAVANVDQVITVIAVKSPDPDFLLLDKLLIVAEREKINAVICINKIDLDSENEHVRIAEAYLTTGHKLIFTSSKTNLGYDSLRQALCGKVSVLAGQSGVGKSTILNKIIDTRVMETGNMSEKTSRGRHTTRHAELIKLNSGGYLADTPGFSSFELLGMEPGELQFYYPEFKEHAGKCRFTGCSHISEPGCSVKTALETGMVDEGRYDRYIKLYTLLKQSKEKRWKRQ